jgi:hypothetical protein
MIVFGWFPNRFPAVPGSPVEVHRDGIFRHPRDPLNSASWQELHSNCHALASVVVERTYVCRPTICAISTEITELFQGSYYVMSPSYEESAEMDDGRFGWKFCMQAKVGYLFSKNH